MIKNFETLAERLKGISVNGEEITPGKFVELLKDEKEHELIVSKLNILGDEDIESLKTAVQKTGYEEGKSAGAEMTIKELKKMWGIETEGKTKETLFKHVNEKVLADAKIPEAEKVQQLNDSITRLQKQYETDKADWESKYTEKEKMLINYKTDNYISSNLPEVDGWKKPHLIAALKADGYGVTFDENGQAFATLNGNIIKDKMEKPLPFASVAGNWLNDNGYTKTDGRGGTNTTGQTGPGTHKTKHDLMKHMIENKIDPTSREGLKMIEEFESQDKD